MQRPIQPTAALSRLGALIAGQCMELLSRWLIRLFYLLDCGHLQESVLLQCIRELPVASPLLYTYCYCVGPQSPNMPLANMFTGRYAAQFMPNWPEYRLVEHILPLLPRRRRLVNLHPRALLSKRDRDDIQQKGGPPFEGLVFAVVHQNKEKTVEIENFVKVSFFPSSATLSPLQQRRRVHASGLTSRRTAVQSSFIANTACAATTSSLACYVKVWAR